MAFVSSTSRFWKKIKTLENVCKSINHFLFWTEFCICRMRWKKKILNNSKTGQEDHQLQKIDRLILNKFKSTYTLCIGNMFCVPGRYLQTIKDGERERESIAKDGKQGNRCHSECVQIVINCNLASKKWVQFNLPEHNDVTGTRKGDN